MLLPVSSLRDFQDRNSDLYGIANGRYYGPEGMFMRLHSHITRILKSVRKARRGQYKNIEYHLCMALSWALAMFNQYHIDLQSDMWKRFPGCCPYCSGIPCRCKTRRRNRRRLSQKLKLPAPISLQDWQAMFGRIYPNEVLESAVHLAEEAGEVNEALYGFQRNSNDEATFQHVVEELVDVVTNIFGVANCLELDLADCMVRYFARGCPSCKKTPCRCGFVTSDGAVT